MITSKTWGFEDELYNGEYCGKRIVVWEQHRSSIHKHEKKDEVLMVSNGLIYFEAGMDPENMSGAWMKDNERIRLAPGTWHRFTGMIDSQIFETSTHHEDADSIRHVTGGKVGEDEFRVLLSSYVKHENQDRILTVQAARDIADCLHAAGRNVGFCNGCFDLIHLGHVELLRHARMRCEVLFVGVNSDRSVRALKGTHRPFVDEIGRMGMVESVRFVDYVVQAHELNCVDLVRAIRPNIYVTTTEHGTNGPEAKEVISAGGKVDVIDMIRGFNTTSIAKTVMSKVK